MRHDIRASDFLVLGSGLAGVIAALELARHGTVNLVTKRHLLDSNSSRAQGGIACVVDPSDRFEHHVRDTLEAGAGLCKEEVVRSLIREAPERIRQLEELGVRFSLSDVNGGTSTYDLGREGGHSHRRVLHAGDVTGHAIQQVLIERLRRDPRIECFEQHVAIDLITARRTLRRPGPDRCLGAYVLDRREASTVVFAASVTVLATGGVGKVYLYTSNPDVATGDGVAMAYRANATIANMEFVQFHPTCLYHPEAKSFLISEAVRGEGARLITADGHPFMDRYHPMGALAPRDIVARAIDDEMKRRGDECVYLDITHRNAEFIRTRFPKIYERCLTYGFDMTRQPVPVVPAAHYACGGAVTDARGRTGIPMLYACGEVGCTGFHGANRLASNSLLEALVVAHRAANDIAAARYHERFPAEGSLPSWLPGSAIDSDEQVVILHNWEEIRRFMWDYVGIVRTDKRLARAHRRARTIIAEVEQYYWDFLVTADLIELRNLATVADLIVRFAQARQESRGLHYTLDYPAPREEARHDTVLRRRPEVEEHPWPA